jgi:hypothetical protein
VIAVGRTGQAPARDRQGGSAARRATPRR